MRLLEVHTCPIWEYADGEREPGFDPWDEDVEPPVVGWCNVAVVELNGRVYRVLLTRDALS